MSATPLAVALVGCGNISAQYLASLPRLPNLRLVSVTDQVAAAAERVALEQGVPARRPGRGPTTRSTCC